MSMQDTFQQLENAYSGLKTVLIPCHPGDELQFARVRHFFLVVLFVTRFGLSGHRQLYKERLSSLLCFPFDIRFRMFRPGCVVLCLSRSSVCMCVLDMLFFIISALLESACMRPFAFVFLLLQDTRLNTPGRRLTTTIRSVW
jgi:hypothetical protein